MNMDWNRRRGPFRPNYRASYQPSPQPYITYDPYQYEGLHARVKPAPDDKVLLDALLKKVAEITPPAEHQAALLSLVTKVQQAFDNLIINPGDFSAAQIEEVRQVGPHRKGTLLVGDNHAHLVIILNTLPTFEAVACLSVKIQVDLQKDHPRDCFKVMVNETGFDITSTSIHTTRILITTIPPNLSHIDPALHLDAWMMEKNLLSTLHCRWFEDNVTHLNIKVLIRLLNDLKKRFEGLKPLTAWIIDVFAHYCVINNSQGQALTINLAFRRALELLSAGIFTAGSQGIIDPCDAGYYPVHSVLSLKEQDLVCLTGQTLLRVLSHGGFEYILGFRCNIDIISNICVLGGIVITPSEKAYEDPELVVVDNNDALQEEGKESMKE